MNRVCVFIDGSNFYFALKRNNHHTRVNYHELSKALAGPDRALIRTYYFNSAYDPVLSPEQWKIQQPFLDSLNMTPYLELKLGKLLPLREGGFRDKGTEVLLAADLVFYAARDLFDIAVVVTENTDFTAVLNQVRELGKHVELCLFPDHQPKELIGAVDRVVPLGEVLEKFNLKIFPEAEEDNAGNRIGDSSAKKLVSHDAIKSLLKTKKSS
jgi:uncharacterized LabA/DUF88 family protein